MIALLAAGFSNSGGCNGANYNSRGRHVRWGGEAQTVISNLLLTPLTRRRTSMTETKEAAN